LKPWGKSDFGFPCCWGTLSESFAKLSDSIFFSSGSTLFVNQFVDTALTWGTVTIDQVAHFPKHPSKTSTLTVGVTRGDNADFAMKVRVPGWAKSSSNSITVNGKAITAKLTPGSYATIQRTWVHGDVVEVTFPPSLWTNPLNDYHPEYNATLAFMYGPLVLAGVHLDSDIFVPKASNKDFKADPSGFITRNSTTELDFEAVSSNGTKIQMIPLKDVMLERYVAYFMTAGTKPVQPHNGYCPHSQGDAVQENVDLFDESVLVSTGAPAPSPDVEEVKHLITSRGVNWKLVGGRVEAH